MQFYRLELLRAEIANLQQNPTDKSKQSFSSNNISKHESKRNETKSKLSIKTKPRANSTDLGEIDIDPKAIEMK